MIKKFAIVCILAFLSFHISSIIANLPSMFGTHSDIKAGWPWVYRISYDPFYRQVEDPTEAFYRNAFIADIIVAILISIFLVFIISFLNKKLRRGNS